MTLSRRCTVVGDAGGFILFVVVFLVHWSLTTSRAESEAAAAALTAAVSLPTLTPPVFSYAATETDEDQSILHQNQSKELPRGACQLLSATSHSALPTTKSGTAVAGLESKKETLDERVRGRSAAQQPNSQSQPKTKAPRCAWKGKAP